MELIDELIKHFDVSENKICIELDNDTKMKFTIFGYVRTNLIRNTNALLSVSLIPPLVCSTLLSYFVTRDCFSTQHHGEYFVINGNNSCMAILDEQQEDGTVYGTLDIYGNLPFIYIWKIKILSIDNNAISIGIDSSDYKYLNDVWFCEPFDCQNKFDHYSLNEAGIKHCLGLQLFDNESSGFPEQMKHKYVERGSPAFSEQGLLHLFRKNDIITIELNIPNKTIKYHKNDIDLGVAFDNIHFNDNKIYHLAISSFDHLSVQIIDFKEIYINSVVIT